MGVLSGHPASYSTCEKEQAVVPPRGIVGTSKGAAGAEWLLGLEHDEA